MRIIDADEIIIRLPFTLPPYNMMLLRNSIMQGIQDTPTVDAEPVRHGSWDVYRWRDYDKTPNTELTCSVCGTTFFLPYDLNVDEFHYCPNCGAKMDEEAEDEDNR